MIKNTIYVVIFIIIALLAFYFLNEVGLIAAIFGGTAFMSQKVKNEIKSHEKAMEHLSKDLDEIRKKRKDLKVDDLSPEEESEYWRNQ